MLLLQGSMKSDENLTHQIEQLKLFHKFSILTINFWNFALTFKSVSLRKHYS